MKFMCTFDWQFLSLFFSGIRGEEIDMKQIEQLPLLFKLKNHIIFV